MRALRGAGRWLGLLVEWTTYPPLLLTLLLVVAIAWGAGEALGVPELLWHERWGTQLLSGAALTLLCGELGVVGYLLRSRTLARTDLVRRPPALRSYVRRPVALFTIALLLAGLLARPRPDAGLRWAAMLGAALGWTAVEAIGVLFARWPRSGELFGTRLLALVDRVGSRLRELALGPESAPDIAAPPRRVAAGPVHFLQAVLATALGVVYLSAYLVPWPAMVVVAVSLAILNALWGFIAYWCGPWRLAVFLLVVLLALGLGVLRDSTVDGLARTAIPAVPAGAGLLGDDDALEAWRRAVPSERPVLVIVAVSGGANRAAAWTVSVLTELETRVPALHRHIRLITGASGGMVGAAHYVSRLPERGYDPATDKPVLVERVARDSLTPLARALLLVGRDRGRALEQAWQQASPELGRPFGELRAGEEAGWRPSLVYSPMLVEDGRRLVASNLDLGPLTESAGPLLDPEGKCPAGPERCRLATSAVQLFELFPGAERSVSLAALARMSATFPWVTTAVALPTSPGRRVVDAGYYDNYGVNLAALWIARHAAWLRANTGGVLLLQVRDERLSQARNRLDQPAEGRLARLTSPLSAPLSAVLAAREATMAYRNDELVQLVAQLPAFADRPGFFRTAAFELPRTEPLSWYLTTAARQRIARSIGLGDGPAESAASDWNRLTFAQLCAWWREHDLPAPGNPPPRCP